MFNLGDKVYIKDKAVLEWEILGSDAWWDTLEEWTDDYCGYVTWMEELYGTVGTVCQSHSSLTSGSVLVEADKVTQDSVLWWPAPAIVKLGD